MKATENVPDPLKVENQSDAGASTIDTNAPSQADTEADVETWPGKDRKDRERNDLKAVCCGSVLEKDLMRKKCLVEILVVLSIILGQNLRTNAHVVYKLLVWRQSALNIDEVVAVPNAVQRMLKFLDNIQSRLWKQRQMKTAEEVIDFVQKILDSMKAKLVKPPDHPIYQVCHFVCILILLCVIKVMRASDLLSF